MNKTIMKPKPKKKKFPYDEISFRASGWMLVFYFGVIKYIKEKYKIKNLNLTGSSGGAIAACLLLCDLDIDKTINELDDNRNNNKINIFNLCDYVKQLIEKYTIKICYHKLQKNILNIACTKIGGFNSITQLKYNTHFFNNVHFTNPNDISNYLKASCHIPLIGGITPYYYNNHYLYDSIVTNSHPHIKDKPLKISWSKGCECGCDNMIDTIRPHINFPLSFCLDIPDGIIQDLYKHGYYQAKLFFENIQENENKKIIKSIKMKIKKYDDNLIQIKNKIKNTILLFSCITILLTLKKLNKPREIITRNIFRIYNSIRSCT
jgi:hypothetical protein